MNTKVQLKDNKIIFTVELPEGITGTDAKKFVEATFKPLFEGIDIQTKEKRKAERLAEKERLHAEYEAKKAKRNEEKAAAKAERQKIRADKKAYRALKRASRKVEVEVVG